MYQSQVLPVHRELTERNDIVSEKEEEEEEEEEEGELEREKKDLKARESDSCGGCKTRYRDLLPWRTWSRKAEETRSRHGCYSSFFSFF